MNFLHRKEDIKRLYFRAFLNTSFSGEFEKTGGFDLAFVFLEVGPNHFFCISIVTDSKQVLTFGHDTFSNIFNCYQQQIKTNVLGV